MSFEPDTLSFTTGRPCILRVRSRAGNVEKPYCTATEFFRTVVTRKFEDSDAELKAPYFRAIELLVGSGGTSAEMFVVPAVADAFGVLCTIPGRLRDGEESVRGPSSDDRRGCTAGSRTCGDAVAVGLH